jgi:hypothetical protein
LWKSTPRSSAIRLRQLRLQRRQLDDHRGKRGEDLRGSLEALVIEGRDDLRQRLDLVQPVALRHALGTEGESYGRMDSLDALVEVLHGAREQRRAHDHELGGREVLLVHLEDAQELGELRVQVLVDRRARDEDEDLRVGARAGIGRGPQVALQSLAELFVAAVLEERKAARVHGLHGRLVDVHQPGGGPGEGELDAQGQAHVTAAPDDGDTPATENFTGVNRRASGWLVLHLTPFGGSTKSASRPQGARLNGLERWNGPSEGGV